MSMVHICDRCGMVLQSNYFTIPTRSVAFSPGITEYAPLVTIELCNTCFAAYKKLMLENNFVKEDDEQ